MFKDLQKRFSSPDSYVSMALGVAAVFVIGLVIFRYTAQKQPQTSSTSTDQTANQTTPPTQPTTYTVKNGDTLWSISEQFYKTGYNWGDIQTANKLTDADYVESGVKLVIPVVTPIMPQEMAAQTAKPKTYTVVAGDTLWDVAVKTYNDGYKWSDIAAASKLENPDAIEAGQVLTLP
jgi:nucleoid-associated protein YgaU